MTPVRPLVMALPCGKRSAAEHGLAQEASSVIVMPAALPVACTALIVMRSAKSRPRGFSWMSWVRSSVTVPTSVEPCRTATVAATRQHSWVRS